MAADDKEGNLTLWTTWETRVSADCCSVIMLESISPIYLAICKWSAVLVGDLQTADKWVKMRIAKQ